MIKESNFNQNIEELWNDKINANTDPLKTIIEIPSESIIFKTSDDFKSDKKEYALSLENLEKIFDYKKESYNIDLDEDSVDMIKLFYIQKRTRSNSQNFSSLNDTSNKSTKSKSEYNKENPEQNLIKQDKILFKTFLPHKRGRKPLNKAKNKKRFSGLSNDILERKIQVNFITFLVNLANDVIKYLLNNSKKITLKQVDYSFKRVTEYNYLQLLKKYSYSDILKNKISKKYKKFPEDYNKIKLSQLCEQSPFLRKFFEQNYLKIFQDYYYNNLRPLNQIVFEEIKINLSTKTKSFYYLLKKNVDNKDVLKYIAKIAYF